MLFRTITKIITHECGSYEVLAPGVPQLSTAEWLVSLVADAGLDQWPGVSALPSIMITLN